MSENAARQPHVEVVRNDAALPEEPVRSTPLAGLRAKVQQARETTLMERSPKALDDVVLHFRALSLDEYDHIGETRGMKRKRNVVTTEQGLLLACDVIATTCVGVYIREGGELKGALGMDPAPTFASPELAQDLGVDPKEGQAADVVKALFPFEGDILSTQVAVLTFSGLLADEGDNEIQQVTRGNS